MLGGYIMLSNKCIKAFIGNNDKLYLRKIVFTNQYQFVMISN